MDFLFLGMILLAIVIVFFIWMTFRKIPDAEWDEIAVRLGMKKKAS